MQTDAMKIIIQDVDICNGGSGSSGGGNG